MKRVLLLLLVLFVSIFDAQINLNIGSTNVGSAPVSSFFSYSYVQQIYPKQEINTTAGNITGLIFYLDPSATINDSKDWTVYVGHTPKTAFTSGTDWVPASQLTQVYSGTVSNNAGKVVVNFQNQFAYDNIGNLVVAVKENSPSIDINNFDNVFRVYSYPENSTLYYRGDRTVVDPVSPPAGILAKYKPAMTISGLTPRQTAACPFVNYPSYNFQKVVLTPDFKWDSSTGATSYKISLGTSAGGTDIINGQVVTGNNYSLSTALNRSSNYYVKVSAVSANGESQECVNVPFKTIPPIPVNDACSGALQISAFPYQYTQADAVSATNNAGSVSICSPGMNDGVWFKFTGDGSKFRIIVGAIATDGLFDPQIGVYKGSCTNLVCVGTVDDAGPLEQEYIDVQTEASTEYYINVGYFEITDKPEDTFTILVKKI